MSAADSKVLLCWLYERTSAKGNRYLAGRLGAAKVIAFLDPPADLQFGATACFNVYVQPGDAERQPENGEREPRPAPPVNNTPIRPGGIQRLPRPAKPADNGEPFHSDPVDDLWRGGGDR
jgi:hypothetical protein